MDNIWEKIRTEFYRKFIFYDGVVGEQRPTRILSFFRGKLEQAREEGYKLGLETGMRSIPKGDGQIEILDAGPKTIKEFKRRLKRLMRKTDSLEELEDFFVSYLEKYEDKFELLVKAVDALIVAVNRLEERSENEKENTNN